MKLNTGSSNVQELNSSEMQVVTGGSYWMALGAAITLGFSIMNLVSSSKLAVRCMRILYSNC